MDSILTLFSYERCASGERLRRRALSIRLCTARFSCDMARSTDASRSDSFLAVSSSVVPFFDAVASADCTVAVSECDFERAPPGMNGTDGRAALARRVLALDNRLLAVQGRGAASVIVVTSTRTRLSFSLATSSASVACCVSRAIRTICSRSSEICFACARRSASSRLRHASSSACRSSTFRSYLSRSATSSLDVDCWASRVRSNARSLSASSSSRRA